MTGEEHRQLQLALRAAVLADLLKLWPMFDPDDITGSWSSLEVALVALIQSRGAVSSQIAADYFRSLGVSPTLAAIPDAELVAESLRIVGPRWAGRMAARQAPADQIRSTVLVTVSGDVGRQVLNAGRTTLAESMKKEPRVAGYRRITDGTPCQFCGKEAAHTHPPGAPFPAHWHCACFPEPIVA